MTSTNNNTHSKMKAAVTCIVAAAMLVIMGLAIAGEGIQAAPFGVAVLSLILACVWIWKAPSLNKWISLVLALAIPVLTLCNLEQYTHTVQDLSPMIFILNLLFFFILYAVCLFLTGSMSAGYIIATLIPMIFGLANYYVVSFRSTPIVPWDLLSIGTAATVADNYSFELTWNVALVLQGFIWIMLFSGKCSLQVRRLWVRLPGILVTAALLVGYIFGIQEKEVQSFFEMDTTLFTLNVLYRNNGIAAAFLGNLRFLKIDQPDGYSAEAVRELQDSIDAKRDNNTPQAGSNTEEAQTPAAEDQDNVQENTIRPNIIVIMDEAFSDLSVWGDFNTSEPVMPFFKSMQQEMIGGEVYVSVKGGNTANSEFEFLTGDTMGFLPNGSIPYQQYIHGETPSIASYLKSMGYSTTAIHPYNASGWCRDKVYPNLGFEKFISLKNFVSPEKFRGYVSDYSAFDRIIQELEESEPGKPSFIFEVTMQNHGGYSKENPDFESYITLPDVSNKTTSVLATEKYLTLMNHTDRALKKLITYLDAQEAPSIVLIFGDHQPSDYITNAIQRVIGSSNTENAEKLQTGYRVPFLIWSNFDMENAYYEGLSVNYLGGILLEAAGVPLTDYQIYLQELQETFPVINGNVIRDNSGEFYPYETREDYETALDTYRMIQYNHLVDAKNRVPEMFGMDR